MATELVQRGLFWLHPETNEHVARVLNSLQGTSHRVRIWLGDAATGRCWMDEYNVVGRIGRSMGPQCIPLLIHNRRSMGGPGILDNCIIRIDRVEDHHTLYKHPTFSDGTERMHVFADAYRKDGSEYTWAVGEFIDKAHARFKTEKQAKNWLAFMRGERYCK